MEKSQAITIFEKMDEGQIMKADKAVKQAMVYEVTIGNQKTQEITFAGIKHIILELAVNDNPLEILASTCKLEKDDPDDKKYWFWRAYKQFRNTNNGLVTDGRSECPYLDNGRYDAFAQRKADSKAERNAQRKQIPELAIKEFLKACTGDEVQNVDNQKTDEPAKPTEAQINYYKNLGGQEPIPKTREQISVEIDKLLKNK